MKNVATLAGELYYQTADPDSGNHAREQASARGLRLKMLSPKQLPLRPDAVAHIVDLDYLCLDIYGRRRWLADLKANPPIVPTFVHSHDFAGEDIAGGDNIVLAPNLDDVLSRLEASLSAVATTAADASWSEACRG